MPGYLGALRTVLVGPGRVGSGIIPADSLADNLPAFVTTGELGYLAPGNQRRSVVRCRRIRTHLTVIAEDLPLRVGCRYSNHASILLFYANIFDGKYNSVNYLNAGAAIIRQSRNCGSVTPKLLARSTYCLKKDASRRPNRNHVMNGRLQNHGRVLLYCQISNSLRANGPRKLSGISDHAHIWISGCRNDRRACWSNSHCIWWTGHKHSWSGDRGPRYSRHGNNQR